jgi:hypothetical protein
LRFIEAGLAVGIMVGVGEGRGARVSVTDTVICVGMGLEVAIGVGLEAGKGVRVSATASVICVGMRDEDVTFAHAARLMKHIRDITPLQTISR